jgi:hypothetical protein
MAVQVDPIKPTLKAPATKRLKLKYDKPLSSFAFNFNLRRCTVVPFLDLANHAASPSIDYRCDGVETPAGAYTRPLFSSTQALAVG